MEITIKETKKGWMLVRDGGVMTKEYRTLTALAKALAKWSKGQNL